MIDEECVTADALTHEGPSGAPRPIIIVQAASFDVFLLTNTERTLIRCGCKKKEMRMHRSPPSPHLDVNPTNALPLLSCHPQRLSISLSKDPWSAPSFPEIDSLRWGHQHHDMGVNHGHIARETMIGQEDVTI